MKKILKKNMRTGKNYIYKNNKNRGEIKND